MENNTKKRSKNYKPAVTMNGFDIKDFYQKLRMYRVVRVKGLGVFDVREKRVYAHWGNKVVNVLVFNPNTSLKKFINEKDGLVEVSEAKDPFHFLK